MQIEINEEFKFASIWLTNDEADDPCIMDNLKPIIEKFREKKYKFVIFYSGKRDLLNMTKDLLKHNKNLTANNS